MAHYWWTEYVDMKVHKYDSRDEYLRVQIEHSEQKYGLCKVWIADVIRYREVLEDVRPERAIRRILCLGVRSGAEVDLFRAVFFGPLFKLAITRRLATRLDTNTDARRKMRIARLLGVGSRRGKGAQVRGVEINPAAARPDVHVGSYDELPAEWSGEYDLLFSNSFDHSMDPTKTVAEWKRVAAPGAFVIIGFAQELEPTTTDPTANISLQTLGDLWQAPLVFANQHVNRNGYHEAGFQL